MLGLFLTCSCPYRTYPTLREPRKRPNPCEFNNFLNWESCVTTATIKLRFINNPHLFPLFSVPHFTGDLRLGQWPVAPQELRLHPRPQGQLTLCSKCTALHADSFFSCLLWFLVGFIWAQHHYRILAMLDTTYSLTANKASTEIIWFVYAFAMRINHCKWNFLFEMDINWFLCLVKLAKMGKQIFFP